MWSLLLVNNLSRDEIKITVSAFGEILSWQNSVKQPSSWEQELFSGMPRAFELWSSEEFCLTTSLHPSHTLLSQIHSPVTEEFFVGAAISGGGLIYLLFSFSPSFIPFSFFPFSIPLSFLLFPLFISSIFCVRTSLCNHSWLYDLSAQYSTVLGLKAWTPV